LKIEFSSRAFTVWVTLASLFKYSTFTHSRESRL